MTTTTAAFRRLEHEELTSNDELLASWLVGREGVSLCATYPQVFTAGGAHAHGAFIDGVLSSHAAVRRIPIVAESGWLRASLVGVVATSPAARGAQLASTMLHRIADEEIAAGQDLILLWSDRWEFYAKLGYVAAGVQAQMVYQPNNFGPAACRRARVEDIPALTKLHADKVWRVDRDTTEMKLLIGGTATDCFVSEVDGEIVAYACHGKGLDFAGWWHEFGGADEAVAALLPVAMTRLGQERATVLVPPYRNMLFSRLSRQSIQVEEGIVALCKPLTDAGRTDFFVDGLDSV